MDELFFSLNTWLALTGALLAAFTPFYILLWKLTNSVNATKTELAVLTSMIMHCPTCQRTGKKI